MNRNDRWLIAAAAAVSVTAGGVATAGHVAAEACPDVQVVFARGTFEPAGVGGVGQAFVDALRARTPGKSVDVYAVNYPASLDFATAADGVIDAKNKVMATANTCPNTKVVLGGYSQGAAVMDVIGAIPVPGIGFNNPLPPEAAGHVAAIAVFGNPSAKLGLPLTASPVWGGKVIDLCNAGDPICQTDGQSVPAHKSYAGGPTNEAANFVAGLL